MVATQQHEATRANATTNDDGTEDQSLFVRQDVEQASEPVSPSQLDTAEGKDDEEDDDNIPMTPPASEKKGPTASETPATKATAKSTSAPKSTVLAKRPQDGVKKAGAAKGAKDEGGKADAKVGKTTKAGKGDHKPTTKFDTAKSNTAQAESVEEGAAAKVEVKSGITMDPA